MSRTTINIDDPIFKEIKSMQKKEVRSIDKIVSQLLAEAVTHRKTPAATPKLDWVSRPMHPRLDLADKEAIYATLDRDKK